MRYEYTATFIADTQKLLEELDNFGSDDWQMTGIVREPGDGLTVGGWQVFFKREKK